MSRGRPHLVRLNIEGFEEFNQNLRALKRAQAAAVMRKALLESAKPTIEKAKELCPVEFGDLRDSIGAGPTLNRRQMRMHRKKKGDVTMFIGPTKPHGHLVEFGTKPHPNKGRFEGTMHPGTAPQPFMRPAWEATKMQVLEELRIQVWEALKHRLRLNERAAARAARRAAAAPPAPPPGGTT